MLEVRGKPVLQHIVEGLREAGVREFLIIVGYHADAVQNFFGDGSRYNVDMQYATQVVQDGTGRVVDLARNFAGDSPFVLNYGDILVDPANYKRLLDLPDDVEAIISVTRGEESSKGGAVFLNERMELIDLREKSKPGEATSPWYNAGHLYISAKHFRIHSKVEALAAWGIRTHRCDSRTRAFRQESESARAHWRMGRRARSGNLGEAESTIVGAGARPANTRAAGQPERLPYK